MGKTLRFVWIVHTAATGALVGCGGDQLFLGGGGDSGCEPGDYVGTFDCVTSADASFPGIDAALFPGFDAALFPSTTMGPLAFVLQGDPGGKSLRIAANSTLGGSQSDAAGSSPVVGGSSADIQGTLDCTTYKLSATVSNLMIAYGGLTILVGGTGTLTADYDPNASPPALVDGVMNPLQPQGVPSPFSGNCTWNAALQR